MDRDEQSLYREIAGFVAGSRAGLLQLLVAAARRSTFNRIVDCPTYPAPIRTKGLAAAVRVLHEAMAQGDTHVPTLLARLYISATSLKHRRLAGQFFTADSVADWALSVAPARTGDDVFDAGAGAAVLADAILRSGVHVRSYIGVESDPALALCAAHSLESIQAPDSFRIWYHNFLLVSQASLESRAIRPPSLVIANPPFVRFHKLVGRGRLLATLKSGVGIRLSSLSGSVGYFLLQAAQLAHRNIGVRSTIIRPRLLFFVPREAAGAGHARRLRDDLHRAHGWTWREHEVPIAQTGVDRHPSNSLALLFVFEQAPSQVSEHIEVQSPSASVGDVLRIRRGISTGCNEFFVLTDSEVRLLRIPRKFIRPVLPTRVSLPGRSFTEADWNGLRLTAHRCWLLALPNGKLTDFEQPVQAYLREGVRRGLHQTPTALHLRTWFALPIPEHPPDVLVTYLFRGAPRFIANRARVYHLTNILGGRFVPPPPTPSLQTKLLDALNSFAPTWIHIDRAGREYRGGLRKIEPKELTQLRLGHDTESLLGPRYPPQSREPSLFE